MVLALAPHLEDRHPGEEGGDPASDRDYKRHDLTLRRRRLPQAFPLAQLLTRFYWPTDRAERASTTEWGCSEDRVSIVRPRFICSLIGGLIEDFENL